MKKVIFKKSDVWQKIIVDGRVIEEDDTINVNDALIELDKAGVIELHIDYED